MRENTDRVQVFIIERLWVGCAASELRAHFLRSTVRGEEANHELEDSWIWEELDVDLMKVGRRTETTNCRSRLTMRKIFGRSLVSVIKW